MGPLLPPIKECAATLQVLESQVTFFWKIQHSEENPEMVLLLHYG